MSSSFSSSSTVEDLACFVLKAAGESVERKHSSYLCHLEALLGIHPVVERENNNANQAAVMDDGYDVTLLEEYAPFDKTSKPSFYPALSALLCEGFQPGSVLSQTAAANSSVATGSITHLEDSMLFQYSLTSHEISVRCAKILYSLIVKLPEDVFSLPDLIQTAPRISSKSMTAKHRHHSFTPATTLLTSFTHHITALPEIEAQVHALQRRARHINLKKTNELPAGGFASSGDSFSERLDLELAAHVDLVTAKLLTALYRYSNPMERKVLRTKIGAILFSFSQISSIVPSSSSTSAVLGERNNSAAAIPGILSTLHRIISGFQAPPLHDSHKLLLLNILIPLHKTNAMVLWRDQEALLSQYHLPLVMCISKILDFDSETSPPLVAKVILALLHPNIWPEGRTSNTPKVVLLLHEIDTLLERHPSQCGSDLGWFKFVSNSLILRLCECISGENSRASERALQMWKNDKFEELVASQLSTCLSPLLQALCRINTNMVPSWNPTVNKMTALVLHKLEERDPELFARVCNEVIGGLNTASDSPALQQQPPPDSEHSETSTFQPVDTSLKTAMGSWKPPARRKQGTLVTTSKQSTGAPPSIVTGIAPWASQQKRDSSSVSSILRFNNPQSKNPPLAITGVAPWAVSDKTGTSTSRLNPQPRALEMQTKSSSSSSSASAESVPVNPTISEHTTSEGAEDNRKPNQSTASQKVQVNGQGIKKLREFVSKICPPSTEGTRGESDSSQFSSWAVAQLSESPLLLPDLKFHDLVFGHELGSGAFSTVKYARRIIKNLTRSRWPEYAVKIISTSKIQELGYEASVNREIAILRTLSHPSIARLISSFRFQDGAYLVLEYASKGDLHDLLRKNGSLDHESTRFVMGEVVAALQSIHDAGFVYSDLKPENILITESGHVKLTDFGACRPFTDSAKQLMKARGRNALNELRDGDWRVADDARFSSKDYGESSAAECDVDNRIEGTTAYLPPEVAMGGTPTPAADSWALGCVLYQCISGKPPILGDTDEQTVRKIVGFHLEGSKVEDELFGRSESSAFKPKTKALIQSLLNLDPGNRLSMLSIAQHEFFAGIDVFTLYKGSAPALMQGSVAPSSRETKWTRRQFSSIWAPQPKAYLLGTSPTRSTLSFDMSAFEMEVEEGTEIDAAFVPKVTSAHTLSKIKEVVA